MRLGSGIIDMILGFIGAQRSLEVWVEKISSSSRTWELAIMSWGFSVSEV